MLQRCGINPVAIRKMHWCHPSLPDFFCALRNPDILLQNFKKTLFLLGVPGLRRHHIVVDETCIAANYELLVGMDESREGRIVGGGFSFDPGSDYSSLDPLECNVADIPEEHKSRLLTTVLVTRNDTNKASVDVCGLLASSGLWFTFLQIFAEALNSL